MTDPNLNFVRQIINLSPYTTRKFLGKRNIFDKSDFRYVLFDGRRPVGFIEMKISKNVKNLGLINSGFISVLTGFRPKYYTVENVTSLLNELYRNFNLKRYIISLNIDDPNSIMAWRGNNYQVLVDKNLLINNQLPVGGNFVALSNIM